MYTFCMANFLSTRPTQELRPLPPPVGDAQHVSQQPQPRVGMEALLAVGSSSRWEAMLNKHHKSELLHKKGGEHGYAVHADD